MPSPLLRLRPVVGLAVAALVSLAGATSAEAARSPILLDDLSQQPAVRPPTFAVTSTAALSGLRWSHWGAPSASGVGTMKINTCEPSCAEGRIRTLPGAELQVQGVRIDQGRRYYRQYRILAPAFSPQDRAQYSRWTSTYVPSDFRPARSTGR
ncbi:hypothetical protein [Peterkaempfera griseoplana]|uniref:hypothetical protein n=1 Tax=Peterkaempfera griseoplana TaxID=66896 RepID=UPI0006E40CC8|nr:hypothetical protein [Peterkaempfera griseoplana]